MLKETGIWRKKAQPECRDIQETVNKRLGAAGTESAHRGETGDRLARWAGPHPKLTIRGQGSLSSFEPGNESGSRFGAKTRRELCFKTTQSSV